jgi:hypothetical protein
MSRRFVKHAHILRFARQLNDRDLLDIRVRMACDATRGGCWMWEGSFYWQRADDRFYPILRAYVAMRDVLIRPLIWAIWYDHEPPMQLVPRCGNLRCVYPRHQIRRSTLRAYPHLTFGSSVGEAAG